MGPFGERSRGQAAKHRGGGARCPRYGLPLAILLPVLFLLALAGGQTAFAAGETQNVTNQPGRDAAISLCDLGSGKAALYAFITQDQVSTRVKVWSGRLPVSRAKLVAGDFNTDGRTDALVLVNLGRGRSRLMLFTSNGKKFTPGATWTSKRGQLDWASASIAVGRFNEKETDCALVSSRLADHRTVVYAFSLTDGRFSCRGLLRTPAGNLAAAAKLAVGDVNGDCRDEAVIFSPTSSGGTLRMYGYDGTALSETSSTKVTGAVGARLSCGDVNGDGKDEPLLLTRSDGSTKLTVFSVDGEEVTAAPLTLTKPFSATAKLATADMNGDGKSDVVAFTRPSLRRGSLLIGLSSDSAVNVGTAWSGAMRRAPDRFACARTLPTIIKENVKVLPAELAASVASIADDGSSVVFSGAPAEVTALSPGDVLILEPAANAPKGVFRIVDSVLSVAGETTVTTSEAGLRDVFVQAEIRLHLAPPEPAAPAAVKSVIVGDHDYTYTNAQFSITFGHQWNVDAAAAYLGSSLTIGAGVGWWADICWRHVWVGAYVDFWQELNPPTNRHTIELLTTTSFSQKDTIAKWQMPQIKFSVGPVPVWIDSGVDLEAYVQSAAAAQLNLNVSEAVSFRLGAQYDGSWTNLSAAPVPGRKDNGVTISDWGASANLSATFGVRLIAYSRLYSLIGPNLSAGPYVRGEASTTRNPRWGVYFGIDAGVGMDIMDFWRVNFATWKLVEWPIVEGPLLAGEPATDRAAPQTTAQVEPMVWQKPNGVLPNGDAYLKVPFTRVGNGTDKVTQTYYRVDSSGDFMACPETRVLPGGKVGPPVIIHGKLWANVQGDGAHYLEFYSKDIKGHIEATNKTYVRIDSTFPTITVPADDWNLWHTDWRGNTQVGVFFYDDWTMGSGLASCSYNSERYLAATADRAAGWYPGPSGRLNTGNGTIPLPNGVYRFRCSAADGAGNETLSPYWYEKVDRSGPMTFVAGADSVWHADPVTLDFTAVDPGAAVVGQDTWYTHTYKTIGFIRFPVTEEHSFSFNLGTGVAYTEYRLNGGPWTRGTSVIVSRPGDNNVNYRSFDSGGNKGPQYGCHVMIGATSDPDDLLPPMTLCDPDPDFPDGLETAGYGQAYWNRGPGGLQISFTATDPGSGVARTEYRLRLRYSDYPDTEPWGAWTTVPSGGSITLPPTNLDPSYRLEYRSIDNGGHVEATKAFVDPHSTVDWFEVVDW